jgi:hypothetical protein
MKYVVVYLWLSPCESEHKWLARDLWHRGRDAEITQNFIIVQTCHFPKLADRKHGRIRGRGCSGCAPPSGRKCPFFGRKCPFCRRVQFSMFVPLLLETPKKALVHCTKPKFSEDLKPHRPINKISLYLSKLLWVLCLSLALPHGSYTTGNHMRATGAHKIPGYSRPDYYSRTFKISRW